MKYIDLGEKIKYLRTVHNLTQEQLADRLGLSKSIISAYENSLRYPSYDILIKLASIFHVSTDYLLGIEQVPMVSVEGLSDDKVKLILELISIL